MKLFALFAPLLLVAAVTSTASAALIFEDDFTTFDDATTWQVGSFLPGVTQVPDQTTTETIAGRAGTRFRSSMGNGQQKGYQTVQTFSGFNEVTADLAFRPLGGIDGAIRLSLINSGGQFLSVSVFAGSFGNDRSVRAQANINGLQSATNNTGSTADDTWQFDTFYRFRINAKQNTSTLSMLSDGGSPIFSASFNKGLAELGSFKIALSQFMGSPNSVQTTDAFVDNLQLANATVPEPSSALVWLVAAAGVVGWRRYRQRRQES